MKDSDNSSLCNDKRYESFFKEQAKALYSFLLVKFGDSDLSKDLVQEAFIKLWENCNKVGGSTAKSYLYKIAVNLGISSKRHDQVKYKYQNIIASQPAHIENETPQFLMEEVEFKEKIKKAISLLPDRQREVFLLSRIEKKTYKEIAVLLDISVKAVEKLMHKALLKIRAVTDGVK
ncbi:RNA polymerase sigma factor [Aquimarina agarivorans]|uniref:RNA polymerase sigma factor n=1 Tax=Aquimarina agarivorans TaxID=980584 RepID=UPI000248E832|nr:sigma-70 family RNA polymerase sigma factor [Aquimarina agarivorans]